LNTIFLALIVAAAPPPVVTSGDFKLTMTLTFTKDAEVWVEMPAPEVAPSYKRLTVEQFRRHGKYIMWAEYSLVDMKVHKMQISRLVFELPKPNYEPEKKKDIVRR
jgi:hypothetical protein